MLIRLGVSITMTICAENSLHLSPNVFSSRTTLSIALFNEGRSSSSIYRRHSCNSLSRTNPETG